MNGSKLVIVGGGLAAGYAAKEFVELGLKPGELTIVSADNAIPYERPSLSKGFLAGRDAEAAIAINPPEFYTDHGIALRLETRVTAVDPQNRRVTLSPGGDFRYEHLVLATGSRARPLEIPGALYLRALDDSKAIRARAAAAKRATVLGGGFIGMEVASVLAAQGIEVTMVTRDARVWERFFTPELSNFFEEYYAARHVRIVKNAAPADFRDRAAGADLVVAGAGAQPITDYLVGSGIAIDDGVTVNEFLETSIPGIYAAGDIANYPDLIFHKRRRVEHWDTAVEHGRHLARLLMGRRTPYRHVPYFFSDVFDLSYEFWGDTSGAERTEMRGDYLSKSFSVWWYRESALVAALLMNRSDDERNSVTKQIDPATS